MKVLRLGLILVTLLILGNISPRANQQKQNNDPSGLKISLISPKVKYRRSEKIKLHVMLNNITSMNIYVLGSRVGIQRKPTSACSRCVWKRD